VNVEEMKLGDFMSPNVRAVAPDISLGAAAQLMADSKLSCLVIEQAGNPVGILTERDLVRQLYEQATISQPVSLFMNTPLITAREGDTLRKGLNLLQQHSIRHLVVLDSAGKLSGIVSQHGLLEQIGLEFIATNLQELDLLRNHRLDANHVVQAREEIYSVIMNQAEDCIALLDIETFMFVEFNDAAAKKLGYTREEFANFSWLDIQADFSPQKTAELIQRLLRRGGGSFEHRHRTKSGTIQDVRISAKLVTVRGKQFVAAIWSDITERKQQQEHIERLAYYDALTNLPNRTLLADRMRQAIAHADRSKEMFAVCYLDLDGFKPINDRLGHKVGDAVLIEIANRLQQFIRSGDTVARLGGDEFVLLMTGLNREDESDLILEHLMEVVTQPCNLGNDVQVSISASVGITFYPTDHNDSDVLLRHADQAMYQAKQMGRNRTYSFNPMFDKQAKKLNELKAKVRAGLALHDFVLYWQPKIDVRNGAVVGAEALLRWKQDGTSILMPNAFLPELENDDLIIEIGDFVMREGVASLLRWQGLGLDLTASLNVPARQLLAHDFIPKLRLLLGSNSSVAERIELEILESAALEDLNRVKHLIDECRSLGISTALDDFGTGYSSMTHFRRLPVDTVKIDQSFVRDMLENADDMAIVQGILGLTKAFGKASVAEGVELVEHLTMLQEMGCHYAQGYAIGHPMPEHEFLNWLKEYEPNPAWVKQPLKLAVKI